MAQSQEYQGAWQGSEYQGAWQIQAQSLSKSLSDSFSFSDSIYETLSKELSDTMSFSDAVQWVQSFARAMADSMSFSDAIAFEMDGYKSLSDVFGFSDVVAMAMSKVLSDSITFTDVISFVQGLMLSLTDTMSFTDVVTWVKSSFINLQDSIVFSDTTATSLSKVLSDAFTFTDSIGTVATMFLNVSDAIAFTDSTSLAFSKVLADIMVIADEIVTQHIHGSVSITERTIAELLADPSAYDKPWMPYIAIGSGDSPVPAVYDTALESELYRKLGEVEVRANTYFVRATFGQDEPTADDLTITEISIQDAAAGGTMGKRAILDTGISKDNIDEIVIEFAVTVLHGTATALSMMFDLPFGEPADPPPDVSGDDPSGDGTIDVMDFSDTIAFKLIKRKAFEGLTADVMSFSDSIDFHLTKRVYLSDAMSFSDGVTFPVLDVDPASLDYGTEETADVVDITNTGTGLLVWDVVILLTLTDVVANGTTTVTSVTGGFTPQMVGEVITIVDRDDFVIVTYVDTNTVIVNATVDPGVDLTATVNTWIVMLTIDLTDVVADGTTTVTSVTGGFTPAMVGNTITIDDANYVIVTYVNTNTIVVDVTVDTGTELVARIPARRLRSGRSARVKFTVDRTSLDPGGYNWTLGFTSIGGNYNLPVDMTVPGAGVPDDAPGTFGINDIHVETDIGSDYMFCAVTRAAGSGIMVYDITDRANPTRYAWLELPATPLRLAMEWPILYATYTGGLISIDCSSIASLALLDSIELFIPIANPVPTVAVSGGTAYVMSGHCGLQVVDVSAPDTMAEIPNDLDTVGGDYAIPPVVPSGYFWFYDADAGWVKVWNAGLGQWEWCMISPPPPGDPVCTAAEFYPTSHTLHGGKWVRISGDRLYIDNGYHIWRLTLTEDPSVVWVYSIMTGIDANGQPEGGQASSFDVVGSVVYGHQVGTHPSRQDYQVPSGASQAMLASCQITQGANSSVVYTKTMYADGYVYIVRRNGLSIVDVGSSAEINSMEPGLGSRSVWADSNNLYLAVWGMPGFHGVNIYDIAGPNSPALPNLVGVAN